MNIEIANRLVKLRKEKGLSQEDLAEALGLSRQAVSKWERAEASPDTDNLICLAKLYNVSLDELLSTDETIDDLKQEQKDKNREKENFERGQTVIDDNEGNTVCINDDGIFLKDADGSHVEIHGKHVYAYDSNGNRVVRRKPRLSGLLEGPLFLLAAVGFIFWGTLGNMWYASWIVFFVPEMVCSLIRCFEKKNAACFNMAMLASFVFFFVCMVYPGPEAGPNGSGLWHPMWVVFLAIPIFYSITGALKHTQCCDCNSTCDCENHD